MKTRLRDEAEYEAEAQRAGTLNPLPAAPTAAQAALAHAPPAPAASGVKQVSYAQKGDALMNLLAETNARAAAATVRATAPPPLFFRTRR